MTSHSYASLVGPRRDEPIEPERVLSDAARLVVRLRNREARPVGDLRALKRRHAQDARIYYTAAAVSRRRNLDAELRCRLEGVLFRARTAIEQAALADIT